MTDVRTGLGLDVHAFASTDRPLVLGGVEIPGEPGLSGHSDADVVAHALADALLGAIAGGDLGSRFGTDDPDLEGVSSLELLGEVVRDVEAAGYAVVNVDLTVVAQHPRLAHHREAMRAQLADTLGLDVSAVSVKITSTDALGSIGRGEGIACWATSTVAPR
ncbi:MAG: 2-C-methyl-D-erythritol 2,4-cyclodiphosphate synthase [Nitriliruptorales bacterium]|nr:2-C-methyl-D-erythritol 2,4-cyclodiphosphate synthase [Nitriliruptorales bacterium]